VPWYERGPYRRTIRVGPAAAEDTVWLTVPPVGLLAALQDNTFRLLVLSTRPARISPAFPGGSPSPLCGVERIDDVVGDAAPVGDLVASAARPFPDRNALRGVPGP
jgi:hypothetical protein